MKLLREYRVGPYVYQDLDLAVAEHLRQLAAADRGTAARNRHDDDGGTGGGEVVSSTTKLVRCWPAHPAAAAERVAGRQAAVPCALRSTSSLSPTQSSRPSLPGHQPRRRRRRRRHHPSPAP